MLQPIQEAASVGFRTAELEVRVERKSPPRGHSRSRRQRHLRPTPRAAPPTSSSNSEGSRSPSKCRPTSITFGLGDKTGSFDRRNQAYTLWNTDIGPQEIRSILSTKASRSSSASNGTRSYGIFLDNTWRTWFDFGKQARDAISFGSEGGPLDYYVLYAPLRSRS